MNTTTVHAILAFLFLSLPAHAQETAPAPAPTSPPAPQSVKPARPADWDQDNLSGLVVLGGAGYWGITKSDRPSPKPGAYLAGGPMMSLLAGYQGASGAMLYRIGGGYLGAFHAYRHESGRVWASRIVAFGDLLWNPGAFRLGGRVGMGLGFGSLGDAYRADHDKSRSLLGLYCEVGLLGEYAIDSHMTVGLEAAGAVDGWTGEDPNKPGSKSSLMASLGGFAQGYFGYRF